MADQEETRRKKKIEEEKQKGERWSAGDSTERDALGRGDKHRRESPPTDQRPPA